MNTEATASAAQPACICCGRSGSKPWTTVENRHGRFPISRCRGCGAAFVWPRPPAEMLRAYYEGISDIDPRCSVAATERWIPYVERDAKRVVARVRRCVPRGRWLDVASGLGLFAREAARNGYRVECVEVSGEHARHTARLVPEATVFKGMFEEYPPERSTMDVVLMSHVLEHARDPEVWLRRAAVLLREKGLLVIEVPNLRSYLGWPRGLRRHPIIDPPQHLTYFTRHALERQLGRHGFVPVRVESCCPFRAEWAEKLASRVVPTWYAGLLARPLGMPMWILNALFNRTGRGLNLTVYALRARAEG